MLNDVSHGRNEILTDLDTKLHDLLNTINENPNLEDRTPKKRFLTMPFILDITRGFFQSMIFGNPDNVNQHLDKILDNEKEMIALSRDQVHIIKDNMNDI